MSVKTEKVVYEPFGNCLKLTEGKLELYVTLDAGPRVIRFNRVGMDNVFFEDKEKTPLDKPYDVYGGDQLRLLGGHRIWFSPEVTPRCYHPDAKPVTYEETDAGAIFYAAVEEHNGIQKIMHIEFEGAERVIVKNTIKNVGSWDIELAVWCITMLAPGGAAVLPQPSEQTGLLPNRSYTFWSYSEFCDPRVRYGKKFITLKQDPNKENPFKIGYNNADGWAGYFVNGQAFFKFFESAGGEGFPDNGCNYETYTNGHMLESESLGEFVLLEPGEETFIYEEWELYEEAGAPTDDEAQIEQLVRDYVSL